MNAIPDNKLRFMKYKSKTYTETSRQVGTDDMVKEGSSVQRTEPTNSNSDTIYVQFDGDDSGTGTSSDPVLTLDQAVSMITKASGKHQIMIQNSDGREFSPPDRIVGTETLATGGIINYHYLTGIYSKLNTTPVIKVNEPILRNRLTSSTLNVIGHNVIHPYRGSLYGFKDNTVNTLQLKKYDYYLKASAESVSLTLSGLLNSNVTHKSVLIDNFLVVGAGSEDIETVNLDTLTNSHSQNIAGYQGIWLSQRMNANDKLYVLLQDGSGYHRINETTATDTDYSTLTYNFGVDITGGGTIQDFIYYNNYFYISYLDSSNVFKVRSFQVVSTSTLSDDSTTTLVDDPVVTNTFIDDKQGRVYIADGLGTYYLNRGSLDSVTDIPYYSLLRTPNFTFGVSKRFYDSDGYNIMQIRSSDMELLEIGEAITGTTQTPFLYSHKNDVLVWTYINQYVYEIQTSMFDLGTYCGGVLQSDTVLLIHSDTTALTTFTDSSNSGHTITANGTVAHTTAGSPSIGRTHIYFNGTTDYLTIPASTDWIFGTGSFTIEGEVEFTTLVHQAVVFCFDNNDIFLQIFNVGGTYRLTLVIQGSAYQINHAGFALSTGIKYYIAIVRNGSTLNVYVDTDGSGKVMKQTLSSYASNQNISTNTLGVFIGCYSTTTLKFNGYIDEFRVTKGTAKYNQSFEIYGNAHPFIDTDFEEGTFNVEGIKLENVFMENCLLSRYKDQKIDFSFENLEDFDCDIVNGKFQLLNDYFYKANYLTINDDDYFIRDCTYNGFQVNYVVMNSIKYFRHRSDSVVGQIVNFNYNTLFNFGQFDIKVSDDLDFRYIVLAGAIFDDFGLIETLSDTSLLLLSLYENDLFVIVDGVLYELAQWSFGSFSKEYVFFRDINSDLRLANPKVGYDIYNSLTYIGAYFYSDAPTTNDDAMYIDLPSPNTVLWNRDFQNKTENTTIDGSYYRDVNQPIAEVSLDWNDMRMFTVEDYNNFITLIESDNWWEVFLDGFQQNLSGSTSGFYPDFKIQIQNITSNKLWKGKIIRWSIGSYNLHFIEGIDNNKFSLISYNDANFLHTVNPIPSGTNSLGGWICYVKPENTAVNARIYKGNFSVSDIQQMSGISLKLHVYMNFDLLKNKLEYDLT